MESIENIEKLIIKAYLKPHCGWSNGVRSIMNKYDLQYEDIDIINYPENYAAMVEKSGQRLCPCVEVNGFMLSDVSGEEVETYLLKNNLVKPNSNPVTDPTNRGCMGHGPHHAKKFKPFDFFKKTNK